MTFPRTSWTIAIVLSPLIATAVFADPPEPKQEVPFDAARKAYLQGELDAARRTYETLAQSEESKLAATLGLVEIDLLVGEYEQGIDRLRAIENAGRKSADWHASLAALLAEIGRYEEAVAHNRRALALDEDHLRARWQLGQCLEMVGQTGEAMRVYERFEEVMLGGKLPDSPQDVTLLGNGFYRYSLLKRHPNLVERTRHVLRETYQDAFDNLDPLYWPARMAAAKLLLEKHNSGEALIDLKNLIEKNPHIPAAHVAMGRIELEELGFEDVEKRVEEARRTNPRYVPAALLLADCRMQERRYADAIEAAKAALAVNPKCIEALAVTAAARLAMGDNAAAQDVQRRVEAINARPAGFHYAMGVWLAARRQFDRAEAEYKKAIEYAPWWPEPRTDLGLCYLETGEEALAKQTLEASFRLDGFNHRTHTILGLLDQLEHFASVETQHFIVKFDRKEDPIVGTYFSEALEAMYAETCDMFGHRLEKKTIVELFPDHMGFSVRIGGRPFIATIGACSGRVIAMASPRKGASLFGRYNWNNVLQHEFAHTVTLDATQGRIAHWYTEACAVYSEPHARPWAWKQLLSDACREDRLFSLEDIDWGFVRPKRPDDRHLAYAQSEWMLEYIIEKHGRDKVVALLKAYRDELPQQAAFKEVFHTDTSAFFDDFKRWAGEQVAAWDMPSMPKVDKNEVETRLEADPDNASLHALLAVALLGEAKADEAEEAVKRAMSLNPDEKLALEVFSHIQVGRSHAEKNENKRQQYLDHVEPYLRRLIRIDPDNASAIKYLGYVEQSWGQWREAIGWLKRYQSRYPEDPDTYRRLAAIYGEQRNENARIDQLAKLAPLVEDNPYVAVQLAEAYAGRGQFQEAARWYHHAMLIDPFDVSTHLRCGDLLLSLSRPLEAQREFEAAIALKPDDGQAYDGLSRVFAAMGNRERAETYKKEAEARGFRRKADPIGAAGG